METHSPNFSFTKLYSVVAVIVFFWPFMATAGPLHRVVDTHWYPATATWYGSPEGDGSTGT